MFWIYERKVLIMEKIELKVEGMHCTGCSTRLQKVLNNLEGVSKAEVSFETGVAKIEYDSKLDLDDIKNAIIDAGFEVK